jgi:hypothetical protein
MDDGERSEAGACGVLCALCVLCGMLFVVRAKEATWERLKL